MLTRRRLGSALALAAALAVAGPAMASHATIPPLLVSSTPVADTRLASAPDRVTLRFNLFPGQDSTITVSGPSGVISSGKVERLGGSAWTDLPTGAPNGTYVVTYRGDFGPFGDLSGSYPYAVGPAPVPAAPVITTKAATPSRAAATTTAATTAATRTAAAKTSASAATATPSPVAATATPVAASGTATVPVVIPTGVEAGNSPSAIALAPGVAPQGGGDLVRTSASGGSHWPLPSALVMVTLAMALAVFGAHHWWVARTERVGLTRGSLRRVSGGDGTGRSATRRR